MNTLRIAILASLIALAASAQTSIDQCFARCATNTTTPCTSCCDNALARSTAPACQASCKVSADSCFAGVAVKFNAFLATCNGSFSCYNSAVAFQRSGNAQCYAIEVQCNNVCLIKADVGDACTPAAAPQLKAGERTTELSTTSLASSALRKVTVTNATSAEINVTAVALLECGGMRWVEVAAGTSVSFPTRASCAFQFIGAGTSPEDAAQIGDCTPPGNALITMRRVDGKLTLDRICDGQ
jgi:hypothetical protein